MPFESRIDLARQFLSARDCCCDKGFSIPLQRFMQDRGSCEVVAKDLRSGKLYIQIQTDSNTTYIFKNIVDKVR